MSQSKTVTTRKPAVPGQVVQDPADWTGVQLERSEAWIHRLSDDEIADIDQAIHRVESDGLDIMDITRDRFPLPVFGATLGRIREQLLNGLGLTLIRGFPIERYSRAQAAAAFERALTGSPQEPHALAGRARALRAQGQREAALGLLEAVLQDQ